jgi:CheY-like chemotaxis protein
MKRILIIEDDQNKIKQLLEWIVMRLPDAIITERHSYQSGIKELINIKYDVVLLDMTLPSFDISPIESGGRLRPFAGKEIIKQMYRHKIFIPVIVVTQFERFGEGEIAITLSELEKELRSCFKNIFIGTVYYNASLNNWEKELDIYLKKLNIYNGGD